MTNDHRGQGARLRRFAERTFDQETLDQVLYPAIADLQHECDGGAAPRRRQLRAYWGLWKTIAFCILHDTRRNARPVVASVATRMAIIFPIVMCVGMIPALNEVRIVPRQLLLMSLPQLFVVALPIAYFFAVCMEQAPHPRRLLPAVLVMSLACSALMLPTTMSIVPRTNQAYRVAVFTALQSDRVSTGAPAHIAPGPGEWTFTELVRKSLAPSDPDSSTARRTLSNHAAISTVPIMLGLVAVAISGYSWPFALSNGVWVLMFYVAALRSTGTPSVGPTAARIWLVNGAFALAGLVIVLVRAPSKDGRNPARFYLRA